MARTAKFTVVLGADNQASPQAKKAESDVGKFLDSVKDKAKGPLGALGDLSQKLGSFGTGLIAVGAVAAGIKALGEAGAAAGAELTKLREETGATFGLYGSELAQIREAQTAWKDSANATTAAMSALLAPVTEFTAEVGSGFARVLLDISRGFDSWSYVTGEAQARVASFKKLVEDTANAVQVNTPKFKVVSFKGAIAEDNAEKAARDKARASQKQSYDQDMADLTAHLNEKIETWDDREKARQELIKQYQEQEKAARKEWNDTLAETDRLSGEVRMEEEINRLLEQERHKEAALAMFGQALHSQISGIVADLATGKRSLAEAAQGLFSGLLMEVGQALISLGTAGLLFSALGTAIPALKFLTGSELGFGASLAAIAGGAALMAGGAAIGSIGRGGSGSSFSGGVHRYSDVPTDNPTASLRGTGVGVSRQNLSSSGPMVQVVIQSVTSPDPVELSRTIERHLEPAIERLVYRGRMSFAR